MVGKLTNIKYSLTPSLATSTVSPHHNHIHTDVLLFIIFCVCTLSVFYGNIIKYEHIALLSSFLCRRYHSINTAVSLKHFYLPGLLNFEKYFQSLCPREFWDIYSNLFYGSFSLFLSVSGLVFNSPTKLLFSACIFYLFTSMVIFPNLSLLFS